MSKVLNTKILAIETSSHACSAAILKQQNEKVQIFEVFEDAPRKHNELILPMLDEVLNQAQCQLSDMTALAFGRGPGAFTGVRIATSAIQAIAYGSDLPVAAISSLAAVAQGFFRTTQQDALFVANDARMNEVYSGLYQMQDGIMKSVAEEKVIAPENLFEAYAPILSNHPNDWSAVGNGWMAYSETLQPGLAQWQLPLLEQSPLPHAQDIAVLALAALNNDQLLPAHQVLPIYLRDNVAKKSMSNKLSAKG